MVSKIFETLKNNGLVGYLEKYGLFLNSSMSPRSTTGLLTVVSDKIARGFNRSGGNQAIALDICKAFVFLANLSVMEFQARYLALFCLFSVIYGFQWFHPEDGKSSQQCPVNAGVP